MAYNSKFTGAQIDALLDASEAMKTSKEDVANKVTSLAADATDEQYPSAKAVKDAIQKETTRATIAEQGNAQAIATKENLTNKVTSIDADADDNHYPSAKAVKVALSELENKTSSIGYVTCDTAAETAAKVVTVTGLTALTTGIRLLVKMTNNNTASNATLNINGLGAKPLYYNNTTVSIDNTWEAGEVIDLYYDGTNFYSGNFQGGNSTGGGGNLILEWNTDAATTRKQVKLSDRKSLLQISYKDEDGNPINEQYVGSLFTDEVWGKNANWNQLANDEDVKDLNTIITGSIKIDDFVASYFDGNKVVIGGVNYTGCEVYVGDYEYVDIVTDNSIQNLVTFNERPMSVPAPTKVASLDRSIRHIDIEGFTWLYIMYSNANVPDFLELEVNSLGKRVNTLENNISDILNTVEESSADLKNFKDTTTIQLGGSLTYTNWKEWIPNGTGPLISSSNYHSFIVKLPIGTKIKAITSDLTIIYFDEEPQLGSQYDTALGKIPLNNEIVVAKENAIIFGSSKINEIEIEITNGLNNTVFKYDFLVGKNILTLGDSNVEFAGTENKSYPQFIAEMTNANVINGGIGGTDLARRMEMPKVIDSSNAYTAFDCISLMEAIVDGDWSKQDAAVTVLNNNSYRTIIANLKKVVLANIDIITIHHCFNDFIRNKTIGETDSINPLEFNGAFNKIVELIWTSNPKIKVYWVLPFHTFFTDKDTGKTKYSDTYTNEGGKTIEEYIDVVLERCKYYGIPYADLYKELNINKFTLEYYCQNKLELHARAGYDYIAEKIVKTLLSK